MNIRPMSLPSGWYPGSAARTSAQIAEFLASSREPAERALAGIVPHAGWAFSGRIALGVIRRLRGEAETVVVVGGHLPPRAGLLAAFEQGYETPLGDLEADLELLEYLRARIAIQEDRSADNTVEIQLPFIKHLYPKARTLALRAAPSAQAVRLGELLAEAGKSLKRSLVVVGSTDLTHYGPNYGFIPHGLGKEAVRWVREVNDRRLVEALLALDCERALELAAAEGSACSAGAGAASASFARRLGVGQGKLVEYATSYEEHRSDSFVGYAGIIYPGNGGS